MAIKWTILGGLVYAAMALYAAAVVLLALRRRGPGYAAYAAGFAAAGAAWLWRWAEVGHVPLQNMFEVCLTLGALALPMTLLARRLLGVGGEAADAFIGLGILVPVGLVFSAEPRMLPPALQSWLFVPHVASYMVAYVVLAKAAVSAAKCLVGWPEPRGAGLVPHDAATHRMVALGFPLLTLGLVLGAVWGKLAWGDYWNWDPKELWSLVSWLVYLAYLHWRAMRGSRHPRVGAALVVAGLVAIALTLLWVNLARVFGGGLHTYAT